MRTWMYADDNNTTIRCHSKNASQAQTAVNILINKVENRPVIASMHERDAEECRCH